MCPTKLVQRRLHLPQKSNQSSARKCSNLCAMLFIFQRRIPASPRRSPAGPFPFVAADNPPAIQMAHGIHPIVHAVAWPVIVQQAIQAESRIGHSLPNNFLTPHGSWIMSGSPRKGESYGYLRRGNRRKNAKSGHPPVMIFRPSTLPSPLT